MIGLGLGDDTDITVKGLAAVKNSSFVYLEAYTSVLPGMDKATLAERWGIPEILEADRELVESGCEEMITRAIDQEVSFCVVGDALCATTHTDLALRAKQRGAQVKVVHNASIMNAVASCGLQLYRFGETVSIPFWTDTWKPDSFYAKIKANRDANLHTLCLLDIKVKEQSEINLMKGRKIYEPPRFMTVAQALGQLLEIEECRKDGACAAATEAVGLARLGFSDEKICFGTCGNLAEVDFGGPLHSLVICAEELHDVEREFLEHFPR